jgi:hypothetical protein
MGLLLCAAILRQSVAHRELRSWGSYRQFRHDSSFGRVRNSRIDRKADKTAQFMTDNQGSHPCLQPDVR